MSGATVTKKRSAASKTGGNDTIGEIVDVLGVGEAEAVAELEPKQKRGVRKRKSDAKDENNDTERPKKVTKTSRARKSAKSKDSGDETSEVRPRNPPGYQVVHIQRMRLKRGLISLLDKKQKYYKDKATTTVCGRVIEEMIQFLDGVLKDFDSRFSSYYSPDDKEASSYTLSSSDDSKSMDDDGSMSE